MESEVQPQNQNVPVAPWDQPIDVKAGEMFCRDLRGILTALARLNGEADKKTGIESTYSFEEKTFWNIAKNISNITKALEWYERERAFIARKYIRFEDQKRVLPTAKQIERDDEFAVLDYKISEVKFHRFDIAGLRCTGENPKNSIAPGVIGVLMDYLDGTDKF